MTNRPLPHQVEHGLPAREKWSSQQTVKAVLGSIECSLGPVTLAAPIKLPVHIFHQIIDEHRAGKKSRI